MSMSDKDSATVMEGQEVPTSPVQPDQTDQPSSQTSIDPLQFLENKDFAEGVRRLLQSDKDKGVAKVSRKVDELEGNVARIAERLGVEPAKVAQAQREIQAEQDMAWLREQRSQVVQQPGVGSTSVDADGSVKAILAAFGLPANDPGAQAVLSQTTGQESLTKIAEYASNLNKPSASVAGIAAPPPSTNAKVNDFPGVDSDTLVSKASLLQRTDPVGSKAERQKIWAELERRGDL